MSGLSEGFSNPSIASTSQERQAGVEKRALRVTPLSREWKSSTNGDMSTINRELAIQLAKHPNVQNSVFVSQCSEEDKSIVGNHKVQLIEAENVTVVNPVDRLINKPENHAMDCIIGHGVHLGQQIPLIQRCHHCKWVQVVHTAPEELGLYKSILEGEQMQQTEIELCEKADQVVAVGPKLADTYKRYLRSVKKDQNVLDLTPSIFTEFLGVQQATEEIETFCVLVIGSGESEDFNFKGYDLAAQAIAELKEKSYQLRFICATGKGDETVEKLLQHGITHNQLIVVCESRKVLARLFCEVDLAIMPSRTEDFGLTALEALSAGLPVLVSGNSVLGKALKKVLYGSKFIVDLKDARNWAKAIRAVCDKDRDVRLAETKHLREKYLEKYSWQRPCGFLIKKLQDLVFEPEVKIDLPPVVVVTKMSDVELDNRIKTRPNGNSEECEINENGAVWKLLDIYTAAHIIFPQNAVPEAVLFRCTRKEPTILSPPLKKDEALVSNVIELSYNELPGSSFNGDFDEKVSVVITHSATDLKGYEVVIKELVDSDNNEWTDLETTNIWQASEIEGDLSSKPTTPFAVAKVTCCSTFAVVCRLKSYTFSVHSLNNQDFSCVVQEYQDVSVTIPASTLHANEEFQLTLKVQEIPWQWFSDSAVIVGPILHIMCSPVIDLLEPATITIPISLQEDKNDFAEFPSSNVRVLANSDEVSSHWEEITNHLPRPADLTNGVVTFQTAHFSWFSVVLQKLLALLRTHKESQPFRATERIPQECRFLACLCDINSPHGYFQLRLFCYPSHMETQVRNILCSTNEVFLYGSGNSLEPLCEGDLIDVELLKGIEADRNTKEDELKLRFIGNDFFKRDVLVRYPGHLPAKVKFIRSLGDQQTRNLFVCNIVQPVQPTHVECQRENSQTPSRQARPLFSSGTQATKQLKQTYHCKVKNFIHDLQEICDDADKALNQQTNLSEDLNTIASKRGFIISDNLASGNCMFYALSEQLECVKGVSVSHQELRETLVEFLRENPKLPDGTDLFEFVHGYSSWSHYLTSMKTDGTWGDYLILCATANCYKTCIHVLSSLDNLVIILPVHPVVDTKPLMLGHIHELHFVSLLPRQETNQAPLARKRKRLPSSSDIQDPKRRKKVKEGTPDDEELEKLAEWITDVCEKLGRRLQISNPRLDALRIEYKKPSEMAYRMLLHWKQRFGSNATYQVLHDALCHELVNHKNLAEKFCYS